MFFIYFKCYYLVTNEVTIMKDNSFNIETGKRIRYYREKKNMTQSELGEKLGVTKNAVYSWEVGKCSIHLDTAKKLCSILEIELNDLTD